MWGQRCYIVKGGNTENLHFPTFQLGMYLALTFPQHRPEGGACRRTASPGARVCILTLHWGPWWSLRWNHRWHLSQRVCYLVESASCGRQLPDSLAALCRTRPASKPLRQGHGAWPQDKKKEQAKLLCSILGSERKPMHIRCQVDN